MPRDGGRLSVWCPHCSPRVDVVCASGLLHHLDLCRAFVGAGGRVEAIVRELPGMTDETRWQAHSDRGNALRCEVNARWGRGEVAAVFDDLKEDDRYRLAMAAIDRITFESRRGYVARDAAGTLCGIAAVKAMPQGSVCVLLLASFFGPRGTGASLLAAIGLASGRHDPHAIDVQAMAGSVSFYEGLGFEGEPSDETPEQEWRWAHYGRPMHLTQREVWRRGEFRIAVPPPAVERTPLAAMGPTFAAWSAAATAHHADLCRSFRAAGGAITVTPDRQGLTFEEHRSRQQRFADGLMAEFDALPDAHPSGSLARANMTRDAIQDIHRGLRGYIARDASGRLCGVASSTWPVPGRGMSLETVATLGGPRGTGASLIAAVALGTGGDTYHPLYLRAMTTAETFYTGLGFIRTQTTDMEVAQNWMGRGVPMALPPQAVAALALTLQCELAGPAGSTLA